MRRLVLLVLALAVVPPAAAADLTIAPRDFSPKQERLRIKASLPKLERVGVQLTRRDGRVLGWIVEPERRRYLDFRWNGRLRGARVWDGDYRIRLVDGPRVLATSPLRLDQTAAQLTNIRARNRSRLPFRGDNERYTTISPNGDKLRESAKISFTLNEPAQVHFEVTRTISAPTTIYELWANLKPGKNVFTWHPHWSMGARTYLIRMTTVDKAGNRRTYGADNAREGRKLRSAVVRVLGVDAGFTGESYVASSTARLAIETDATELTLQTFRAGRRGHAHAQRHDHARRAGESAGDDSLGRAPSPGDAQLRGRAVGDRRLLRQADRERRPHRLRAVRRPADDARRAQPRRRRDADEHVAGLQLPRPERERMGRHLVRQGRPEHGNARPDVHPARCPAAVAQVRRRLHPLAPRHRQAARLPDRDRPRVDPDGRGADPPLRLRPLPRPHRVRDAARVRPDPQLPRPRRQPRLPLGEQLLLGGAPAGPDAAADAVVARDGPARVVGARRPVPRQRRRPPPEALRRPLGLDRTVALGRHRPRRRRHLRPGARRLWDRDRHRDVVHAARGDRARRDPGRVRARPDRSDDLLRDAAGREGLRCRGDRLRRLLDACLP